VRNRHELGECQPPEECVVCHLEIAYLELHVLSRKVFSSPEGHRKSDLVDGGHCCSEDYSVEGRLTGTQCGSRQPHMVEGLQEQDV
jgi:hypothetical protein